MAVQWNYAPEELTTIAEVDAALESCMQMWQAGGMKYQHETEYAARYAALLKRKKELGATAPGPVKPSLMSGALTGVIDEIVKDESLSISLQEIDPMVKAGVTASLHQVVATILSIKRAAMLVKYQGVLKPHEKALFEKWLDNRIENKIKARTEGQKSIPYHKAYLAACVKYGVASLPPELEIQPKSEPVATEPTASKKKPTKKATVVGATGTSTNLPTLKDIKDLLVYMPTHADVPTKLRGEQVVLATEEALKLAAESDVLSGTPTTVPVRIVVHNALAHRLMKGESTDDGRFQCGALIFGFIPTQDGKKVVALTKAH